ncbi:MAG: phosphatase PAP2 family protein [Firmicutes bacterium]|nr:phosphatase PAP2 family protein [Bacillota bacterium]
MTKKRTIIMIICLAGFAVTAWFVETNDVLPFDTAIRQWFYSLRSSALTPVLKAITYMGNWQTISGLCILLLFLPKTRMRYGVPVSISAIFITAFNKGIKQIFQRPRPDVSLHLIDEGGYSFTSGHSITSMVVYGLLIALVRSYVKDRKTANVLTVLLAIPWICIGPSRIYMGVHYPTDVLGGWLLGAAALMVILSLEERYRQKLDLR